MSKSEHMSRQRQRPLPSHPQPLEYRAPKSNPHTHTHAPQLRKSMSRVLSRVISITRKEQPPTQATLREGNEKSVHIDRGYEVIPRVTSTHLKRSQNGLREVETNVHLPHPQHVPHRTPKEYPFYSHPQISDYTTFPAVSTRRRQSITTKLSRNQIASFRKASSSSQVSVSSSSTRTTAGSDHERANLVKSYPKRRGYRENPGPRRHLASSRSTIEMKGRSSGESTRPSSSSEEEWAKTPVARRAPTAWSPPPASFETAKYTSSSTTGPYQSVCPEKLIQRRRTTPTPPSNVQKSPTPTFARPRPPAKRTTPQSATYRKPVPTFDSSPCSTTIEIASTNPDDIRRSIPVNDTGSQSLDDLFDEVMNACLADGSEDDQIPLMSDHIGWEPALSPMSPTNKPITPAYRAQIPLKMDSPTPTKARPSSMLPNRFIPSGRSFEPLRKTNTGTLPIPSVQQTGPVKEGAKTALNIGSKVKDAIAKFELKSQNSTSSQPSTPVRVLGSIINRPSSVSSAGLSSESRRLMWEARQSRMNR